MKNATPTESESSAERRSYLFRGDETYKGGPCGLAFGTEAAGADIQDAADHILRKEHHQSSRFRSFTLEVRVAQRFTRADDNRHVVKASVARLLELEANGVINVWDSERVYLALCAGTRKQSRQAVDVRAAMQRNSEVLIEGQIPAHFLDWAS